MEVYKSVFYVVGALERLGIPYMVVGSLSSSFYGIPRSTVDADLVIQLTDQSIGQLTTNLGPEFALDPQMSFETITATQRYVLRHVPSRFKIELFMLSPDAHDISRFSRRKLQQIEGQDVYLPAPEDVIVTKLRWSKGGNRAKDVEDVKGVLGVQRGTLDLGYIRRWCDQHGTRELFEQLLQSNPS